MGRKFFVAVRPRHCSTKRDHLQQLDRLIVADVVDPVGRAARAGIGPGAAPLRVGLRDAVHHAEHALDDVVDVGEVSPHAAVIEDVDRPTGENRPGKEEQGHVGPAPGTIDRKEPQPGGRQPEEMAVGMGHQLVGLLRGRIQAHGMIDVLMHRERHLRIGPVDRARRGIDQVLDARVPATFQNVRKTQQIAVDVNARVLQGITHSGLGRQIDDQVESLAFEQSGQRLAVGQVELHEAKPGFGLQLLEAIQLQLHRVIVVDVVQAHDRVAAGQQTPGGVKPNEPGGAG